MFWVVIAILVVGYFIVRAINGNSATSQKLIPIGKRIAALKEHDDKLQTYLGDEYKKELEEYKKLRYHKHEKYSWKTWDKDQEDVLRKHYDDFCRLVELNSRICQRLASNEQSLLDQLVDWGTYLEQFRDIQLDKIGVDDYINAGLDIPYDEVAASERSGVIQETYKRIMSRAKSAGITDKRLVPSFDKNISD